MSDFVVRTADAEDREAVLQFDKEIWGGEDYIPHVWDEWLRDREGRLYVCTFKDRPVGIGHVDLQDSITAWLEGGRVDPKLRRKGVGTRVAKACMAYARQKGRKIARLATSKRNVASYSLNLKLGFQVISGYVIMVGRPMETGAPISRRAQTSEEQKVWTYMRDSPVFEKAAGLYTRLWEWYALTPAVLHRFIEMEKAVIYRPDDAIEGVMLVDDVEFRDKQTQTCYLDGSPKAIQDLAGWLLRWSAEADATKANVFTVNHEPIVSTLNSLGFERRHGEIAIFEKKL